MLLADCDIELYVRHGRGGGVVCTRNELAQELSKVAVVIVVGNVIKPVTCILPINGLSEGTTCASECKKTPGVVCQTGLLGNDFWGVTFRVLSF